MIDGISLYNMSMRDPARIPRIIAALEEYWKAHPDLRLGQIVVTATSVITDGSSRDPFYIEDEKIEVALGALATGDLPAFYNRSGR